MRGCIAQPCYGTESNSPVSGGGKVSLPVLSSTLNLENHIPSTMLLQKNITTFFLTCSCTTLYQNGDKNKLKKTVEFHARLMGVLCHQDDTILSSMHCSTMRGNLSKPTLNLSFGHAHIIHDILHYNNISRCKSIIVILQITAAGPTTNTATKTPPKS